MKSCLHFHKVIFLTYLFSLVELYNPEVIVLNPIDEDQPAGIRVANLLQKLQSQGLSVTKNASISIYEPGEKKIISSLFNLDKYTGELTSKTVIDRDSLCHQHEICCELSSDDTNPDCSVNFNVIVRHSETRNTFSTFQITIRDQNDNTPTYRSNNRINLLIKENIKPGEKIELPLAVDDDARSNSVIKYEIIRQLSSRLQSVSPPAFSLTARKRSNGRFEKLELVTLAVFDREENPFYIVEIDAVDGGNKRGRLTVNVTIEDENDCIPTFKNVNSNYHLRVKEDVLVHTVLLTLKAEDCDIGFNGQITYYLAQSNDKSTLSTFSINPNSGEITNNSPLDFETQSSYRVTVIAKDGGNRKQSSEVTITIDIEDVNDNLPQIKVNSESSSGRYEVPENQPRDFIVATVKVHDPDSGDNGRTACELTTGSREFEMKESGLQNVYNLITLKSFDREEVDKYDITITCHDFGTPYQTLRASKTNKNLRVYIIDKNDNRPIFDNVNGHYFFNIDENNHYRLRIGKVQATDKDKDINSFIRYSIDEGSSKLVSINPLTGDLNAETVFDREQNDQFIFHVVASNTVPSDTGEKFSVTATVTVSINDVNDNPPVFTEESYNRIDVSEDTKRGEIIGRVHATDLDTSKNKEIEFQLHNGTQYFKLSHNGELSIRRELDREKRDEYCLFIRAVDKGQPQLSANLFLRVNVVDANDNQPRFIFPSAVHYVVNLSLDFVPGNTITKVVATDEDTGLNAKIKYYILGNNSRGLGSSDDRKSNNYDDIQSLFSIDEDTGDLKLSRDISNSKLKTYMLHIEAKDQGLKPLSETRLLQIKMIPSTKEKPGRRYAYSSVPNMIIMVIAGLTIFVLFVLLLIFVLLITKKVRSGNQRDFNQKSHPQSNCYDDIILNRKEQPLDQSNMDTYVAALEGVPPECAKALLKSSQGDIYLQESYDMLLKSKECADYYNQLKQNPDNESQFYYSADVNKDAYCSTIRSAKSYPHLTNKLNTIQNLPSKNSHTEPSGGGIKAPPVSLGSAYTKLGSDHVTFTARLAGNDDDGLAGVDSATTLKKSGVPTTLPLHVRYGSDPKSTTMFKSNQYSSSKGLRYPYDDISHV